MIYAAKWIWRNHSNKVLSLAGGIITAIAAASHIHFEKGVWFKIRFPLVIIKGNYTLRGGATPDGVADVCCTVFIFGLLLIFAGLWRGLVVRRRTYRASHSPPALPAV